MRTIRTILLPTDFSPHAIEALEVASAMARAHAARLVILHVVPSHEPVLHYARALGFEPPEVAKIELSAYQQEMERKLQTLRPTGTKTPVEHLLKEGAVGNVIVQTAEQIPCDLIVMGTRGQSAPSRSLFGSIAEEVSRRSTCPVITVQIPSK